MDSKFFNKQMQEKALQWLNTKWEQEHRNCEICGKSQWTFAPELVMPLPYVGGNISIGGPAFPHILLTCNTCGNAKFFNAVLMGIVPQGDNSDEK
jgi:hypothetical protein